MGKLVLATMSQLARVGKESDILVIEIATSGVHVDYLALMLGLM